MSSGVSEITTPVSVDAPMPGTPAVSRRQFFVCASAAVVRAGASQFLRLVGNLVLTRLLFPEAFGLMALVNVFLIGLVMLSDLGVGPAIVQRRTQPDAKFLETAWTFELGRSVGIWLLASVLAYPLSLFYGEPQLFALIPAVTFSLVLNGLRAPAVHLCSRELKHGSLAVLELTAAVIGLAASILLAWWTHSVWALVVGGWIAALTGLAMSYFLPLQVKPALRFEKEGMRELFRFGRWIFLSSALTFLAAQGDRLILGKVMTFAELGIYTVAFFFAQTGAILICEVSDRALFPVLSKLNDAPAADRLREIKRYRAMFLGAGLAMFVVLFLGGQLIVDLMYDDRYAAAGGMLRVLSLGGAASILAGLTSALLLAQGSSFWVMMTNLFKVIAMILGIGIGGWLGGLTGFIWGLVAAQFVSYVPVFFLLRRFKLATPALDFAFLGLILVIALLGFWAMPVHLHPHITP